MDCRTVEVSSSFGESVLLKFPEFPECDKPDIRLKNSVISANLDDLAAQEYQARQI